VNRTDWRNTWIIVLLIAGSVGLWYGLRAEHARREWSKRLTELGTTSANAAPVIAALQRYTAKHGSPPPTLKALIPTYLPALPTPGSAARIDNRLPPSFSRGQDGWFYHPQGEDQPVGVWVLGIEVRKNFCPRCGHSFGDFFVYHSNGSYPHNAYGGVVERVGAWDYYHE
jgi:hypothetical protein